MTVMMSQTGSVQCMNIPEALCIDDSWLNVGVLMVGYELDPPAPPHTHTLSH